MSDTTKEDSELLARVEMFFLAQERLIPPDIRALMDADRAHAEAIADQQQSDRREQWALAVEWLHNEMAIALHVSDQMHDLGNAMLITAADIRSGKQEIPE